jgi:hypothetical protein
MDNEKFFERVGHCHPARFTVGKTYRAYQNNPGSKNWYINNDNGEQTRCESAMLKRDLWEPVKKHERDISGTYERVGDWKNLTVGKCYALTLKDDHSDYRYYETKNDHGEQRNTTKNDMTNHKKWRRTNQPAEPEFQQTQPEQDPMPLSIKKTTLINDADVDNVSPEAIMDLIKEEGQAMATLDDVNWVTKKESKYVSKELKKCERNIAKLVKLLDTK